MWRGTKMDYRTIKLVGRGQLRKNLYLDECVNWEGGGYVIPPTPACQDAFQFTRNILGEMTLTSVYRTEEYNSRPSVGGDPNSYHLTSEAMDWYLANGWGAWTKETLIQVLKAAGWKNIGFYYNTNGTLNRIHTDVGDTWDGTDFMVMNDIIV